MAKRFGKHFLKNGVLILGFSQAGCPKLDL